MSVPDSADSEGTVEECIDEINDFVATLGHYPPTVLALALRAHLTSLLRALQAHGDSNPEEVAEFLAELGREALQQEAG
jgi:hypothetical protein